MVRKSIASGLMEDFVAAAYTRLSSCVSHFVFEVFTEGFSPLLGC